MHTVIAEVAHWPGSSYGPLHPTSTLPAWEVLVAEALQLCLHLLDQVQSGGDCSIVCSDLQLLHFEDSPVVENLVLEHVRPSDCGVSMHILSCERLNDDVTQFSACDRHMRLANCQRYEPRDLLLAFPLLADVDIMTALPHGEEQILLHDMYTRDPEHEWVYGNSQAFTVEQQAKLRQLVINCKAVFAYKLSDLTGYTGTHPPFEMNMTGVPPYPRRRRVTPDDQVFQDSVCNEQLSAGIIEPSNSLEYCAENTYPRKKDEEGRWTAKRMCTDYREHNKLTPLDPFPVPRQDALMDQIGDAVIFSKLDLKSGYWQLHVKEEDRPKTTFRWGPNVYQFKRLPMGLKNAVAYFMRVMTHELRMNGLANFVACYIDDLLIYSRSAEEHLTHLEAVLTALMKVGLKVHPGKSIFAADSVEFLGHFVSRYGMSPASAKVAAIRNLPPPANVAALRAALGLFNYYRDYCPMYSSIAQPLYTLLQAGSVWRWTAVEQQAYDALKHELSDGNKVVRRADFSRTFTLHTDFSNYGCGAVLGQRDDEGKEYIVACASRSLNRHEQHYSSFQGEMLAVVWAVRIFRYYLQCSRFELVTDHQPLSWLMRREDLAGQHCRWAMILQDYDFTITHRPGVQNANADALSRLPLPSSADPTGARLDPVWADIIVPPQVAVTPPVECMPTALSMMVEMEDEGGCIGSSVPGCMELTDALGDAELQRARTLRLMAQQACTNVELGRALEGAAAATFWTRVGEKGVVVVDLFGGICAGLEAVLRIGVPVAQHAYADVCPAARKVAEYRLNDLRYRYASLVRTPLTTSLLMFVTGMRRCYNAWCAWLASRLSL